MDAPMETHFFYSPLIKKAMKIAFEAHKDQTDKSGLPYIYHPFHLAEQMETEAEICTALLHDVVEDTPITLNDLRREGFPDEVLDALALMTHDKSVPYMEYVARIRENPVARRVKLADLSHNSNLSRLEEVTEAARKRVRKYDIARTVLADDPFDDALGLYVKTFQLPREAALCVLYRAKVPSCYILRLPDAAFSLTPAEGEALRLRLDASLSLPEGLTEFLMEHSAEQLLLQGVSKTDLIPDGGSAKMK